MTGDRGVRGRRGVRTPVDTTILWHGLLSLAVYAVLFCPIAWARFTSGDFTS
jgi:ABC-type transport system involved in multi-copper enzyme maturation permease subunit